MAAEGETSPDRLGSAVSATAVGLAGLFAIVAWVTVLASVLGVDTTEATTGAVVIASLANGLGTASVAAIYFHSRHLGFDYLDLPRPDRRDVAYTIGGVVALFVLNITLWWVFTAAGMETSRHGFIRQAESNPEILLALIPLAYLVIGPGEELLYRNVVQKSLYGSFSRGSAVLLASAIFAVAHVGSYLDPGAPLATLNGLLTVFALSTILGVIYLRTRSVLVVAVVHASFDAIAFAFTYIQLT